MSNDRLNPRAAAKAFTAEIEAAASASNASIEANAELAHQAGASTEQAQYLGGAILSNGENLSPAELANQGERELALDTEQMMHRDEHVGETSFIQEQERQAAEDENLRNENDPRRDLEAQLVKRGQDAIAAAAATEVDAKAKGTFHPLQIEATLNKYRNTMLDSFENPHAIGSGN